MNFKSLTSDEQHLLLKFPVYISFLAANTDGKLDQEEKLSAIEFNHVKTYSCDPNLADFFGEVDKNFTRIMNELNKELPLEKEERDDAIKKKLSELDVVVLKLGPTYASIMHKSMPRV